MLPHHRLPLIQCGCTHPKTSGTRQRALPLVGQPFQAASRLSSRLNWFFASAAPQTAEGHQAASSNCGAGIRARRVDIRVDVRLGRVINEAEMSASGATAMRGRAW